MEDRAQENTMEDVLIGIGVFSWPRGERVSDRYGSCVLLGDSENGTGDRSNLGLSHLDVRGSGWLLAEVIETRESQHIGDLFRELEPMKPEMGELIFLGHGAVFFEDRGDWESVGVKPDEEREKDWMNPEMLYRAHDQTVRLLWRPDA